MIKCMIFIELKFVRGAFCANVKYQLCKTYHLLFHLVRQHRIRYRH